MRLTTLRGRYVWMGSIILVMCMLTSCATAPQSVRWSDPNFARGRIPINRLELLPMSLAIHIDGLGPAGWDKLKRAHKKVAQLVDQALQRELTTQGYKLYRGQMSRHRLFDLIEQIGEASKSISTMSPQARQRFSLDVNPQLIAGGPRQTDAVLVVDGLANLTTGGKVALQVTVVVVLVALIVAVIVAAIAVAAASKGKGGKGSKGSKGKYARARRTRGSRTKWTRRRARGTRYGNSRRSYRRRYYKRRYGAASGRLERSYRYRGRVIRYSARRRRRAIAALALQFYAPFYLDQRLGQHPPVPSEHKQPFFSSSFLELGVSMVEKGTGILLWHDFHRWKIDPTNPQQIKQTTHKLFSRLPHASPPQPKAP